MRYETIEHLEDRDFKRLTGVQRETFAEMLKVVEKGLHHFGQPPKLSRADQLLMTLMYWRESRVLLAMKKPKTWVSDLCQKTGMTRFGIWRLCRQYEADGLNATYDAPRSGRPREITALQRVSIEQLACCEPGGVGLEMTHWSTRSLVPHIAHSTVSLILRNADLQPHRSRYWITPTLNAEFLHRAGCILWLYERIETLQAKDEIALALNDMASLTSWFGSISTTATCAAVVWTRTTANTCAEHCPACHNLFTLIDAFI